MVKMVKTQSNSEAAKQAAFDAYKDFGSDYAKGLASIPSLFERIAKDATAKLIEASDIKGIVGAWASGAGEQAASTVKKMDAYVGALIAACTMEGIKFTNVVRAITKKHDEMAKAKRKRRTLSEAYVSAARAQRKQATELNDRQIKECLTPLKKGDKEKLPVVTRMVKAVGKLSDAEARQLMVALEKRFEKRAAASVRTEVKYQEPEVNPIEKAIKSATGARLLERKPAKGGCREQYKPSFWK